MLSGICATIFPMKKECYIKVSGIVFTVVGAVHLLRIFNGWDLIIGAWAAPMGLSLLVVLFAGYLAYSAYILSR